jgi:hypothetical protein
MVADQLRRHPPCQVDQLLATGDRGDVDRQRDTLTAIFGRELLGSGLAGPGLARGDVDLGSTVAEKSGRDHLADTARAAGHQRNAPLSENRSLSMTPPVKLIRHCRA